VRSSLEKRDVRADRVPPRIWSVALLWGELPFLAAAVIGLLLAFGQDLVGGLGLSITKVLRVGGLYFYAFHRVTIHASATRAPIDASLSVAFLLVTALAVFLLFVGGSRVGERIPGGPAARALGGASVGLPYAALSLMMSYAVGVSFGLPADLEGGELRLSVSHLEAFVWPLAIGVVAGLAGGLWSARSELRRSDRGRWVVGAMAGGTRMFLYGLGLALAGLVVLGAAKPSAVREYVDQTTGGGLFGKDLLVHHVLALPNQSLWVLVPAMGACDRVSSTGRGAEDFLCYSRFPRHGDFLSTVGRELSQGKPVRSPVEGVSFGGAPPGFLLFLLVPLISVTAGAAVGARASEPPTRIDAALQGALGGLVFAVLVAVTSLLSSVGLHLSGGGTVTAGPDPVLGGLVALAWGIVGGAAGGSLGWPRHAVPASARMERLPRHVAP
jgi:hypothetical protein